MRARGSKFLWADESFDQRIDLPVAPGAACSGLEESLMGRKLLAGILGGVAFFAWSFVAHVVLPLGQTGTQPMPNEQAVIRRSESQYHRRRILFLSHKRFAGERDSVAEN